MTTLANKKRRNRTNAALLVGSQTFNSPGIYKPEFGKDSVYVTGRGDAGTSPVPSSIANYNPTTPSTYAGTNPTTGGNYAGTNPSTGGNATGTYNTYVPGNVSYNPAQPALDIYTVVNYANGVPAPYTTYQTNADFVIAPFAYTNNTNHEYGVVNVSRPAGQYVPGNSYYNPGSGGNQNYNAVHPGTAYYNPTIPGTAYYNPAIPGNANYNVATTGSPGATYNVLGVTFPGGALGTLAPVVPPTLVKPSYSVNGTSIPVGYQGYVTISEK